jgi:hypothetical protein
MSKFRRSISGRRVAMSLAALGVVVAGAPASAAGSGLAGYSVSGLAAAAHIEFDSPGLFPVGDVRTGELFELDVPFSRVQVSSGPVVDALATPLYPGDTVAHLGSAVAEFGGPDLPNDPAVAEAQYPPSPGHGTSASLQGSPPPAGALTITGGDGSSTAAAQSAKAESGVGGFSIVAGGTPLIAVSSSSTSEHSDYGAEAVSAADASVGSVTIAGLLHIAGISGSASASSDGASAVPKANLHIGAVSVAGQKAWIDQDGVHVGGASAGSGAAPGATAALNQVLSRYGITVSAIAPRLAKRAGEASASAGGVIVTIERTIPAVGVPGVPALEVPGAPPIPLGTPAVPATITIALGDASAAVDATTASSTLAGLDGSPSPGATAATAAAGGFVLAGRPGNPAGTGASGITGPGSALGVTGTPTAASSGLPGSRPVPLGLVVLALLAALVLATPLLGYARWQLLGGRR